MEYSTSEPVKINTIKNKTHYMSSKNKKDSFSFDNDPGKLPEDQDNNFTFTDIPILGGHKKKDAFSFDDLPKEESDPSIASFEALLAEQPKTEEDDEHADDISALDATASVVDVERMVKSRGAKKKKKKMMIISVVTGVILVALLAIVPMLFSSGESKQKTAEGEHELTPAEKARRAKKQKEEKIAAMIKSANSTFKKGDTEKALATFKRIIAMDNKSTQAYTGAGRCNEKLNNIDEAKKNYQLAIDNGSETPEPYHCLALLLIEEKKLEQAKELLEKGHQKFPKAPTLSLAIGKIYYNAGEYEKALDIYNSVKSRSNFSEDAIKKYTSLLSKESKQKAKELLLFGGKKFKNASFLISASELAGSPKERVEILEKALKILPAENTDISEIKFLLTEAQIANGNKSAAAQTMQSIDLSKLDKKYCRQLVNLAVKAGMSDIKGYCLKLLESNPQEIALQEAILQELEEQQTPEDLLSIYSSWLQKNSRDPAANYLYALALGNSLSAEKYLRNAIEINPDFYEALIELAKIEMNNNQLGSAKTKLEKAIKQEPKRKTPRKLLAIVKIEQGQGSLAIKEYAEFLESINMDKQEKIVELLDIAMRMHTPQQADKYLLQLQTIPSMHQQFREYNAERKLIFGGASPSDFKGPKTGKLRQYYMLYILSKGEYSTLLNLRTSKEEFPEFWKIYIMKKKKIDTWKSLAELYLKKNITTGDLTKLLIVSMWLQKKSPDEVEEYIKRLPQNKKGITYALIAEEYVRQKKTTKAIIRFKKAMKIPRNIYSDVIKEIYNSLRHSKHK